MGDCEREQRRLMSLWEDVQNEELDEISSDEGEIDHLSESDHNSETEQEISDEENDTENDVEGVFYTGKDDVTKWFKHPPRPNVRRFQFLLCCLRFDNYETRQERVALDKLAPIRTIFDAFVTKCRQAYSPSMYLRVYMKSKPAKYGIKIWVLADSETSYCKNLQVYLGKVGNAPERDQGRRVVLDLVSVLNPGHGITMDNFFTSLELAEELVDKKLTLCGTLRRNKAYIPADFLPSRNRPIYSSIFGFQSEVSMVSYVPKVNRAVILLSTEHRDMGISQETHKKPDVIMHYNATKGAVDTLDKMVAEYSCNRQSKRWPAVMFMNLIDIAAVNAFVLWQNLNPEWNASYLDKRRLFLLELAKELVGPHIRNRVGDPAIYCRLTKMTRNNINSVLETISLNKDETQESEIRPNEEQPKSGRRCYGCPRSKDKKVKTTCAQCKRNVCPLHSKTVTLCKDCEN
ncbi:piggyBac transposable element-derived protein 4-like [Photinus pyralis]|uniref:piggyBac transposable element-derived protein 4-like n=1 Tax=Photinus pyralis TaxID=7054 RepID=UPI001266FD58|nr:piggyBac transposable element-derived protein 4-like [Photinus pyralis]